MCSTQGYCYVGGTLTLDVEEGAEVVVVDQVQLGRNHIQVLYTYLVVSIARSLIGECVFTLELKTALIYSFFTVVPP